MRAPLLIATLCIASLAFGQEGKAPETKKSTRQPTPDQRGTKQQPLVIEGVPAKKTEAETREEQEHRAGQRSIAASIRDSLKAVAHESEIATVITIGLLLVAVLQALLFLWQLWDLRHATRAAASSARAARRSALAQERALKTSMTIEGAALIVDVEQAGLAEALPAPQPAGVRPVVMYSIRNFGRSAATVIRFQDRLRWASQLPIPPDFDGESLEDRPARNVVIVPERNQLPIQCGLPHNIAQDEWDNAGNLRLHLVSRIEFQDVFGRVFVQGFAVRITRDPVEPRFTIETAGGPVYNYKREKQD